MYFHLLSDIHYSVVYLKKMKAIFAVALALVVLVSTATACTYDTDCGVNGMFLFNFKVLMNKLTNINITFFRSMC